MTNNKRRLLGAAALIASLTAVSFSSSAALINRGAGMVYDTVLDITWMLDANYMQTSGFNANGLSNFATAKAWADSVIFGGFDDWRLPSHDPTNGATYDISFTFDGTSDRGYNNDSTQTELGYMFHHNLNNVSFFSELGQGPQPGSDSFNTSFVDGLTGDLFSFENVQATYWTEDEGPFANTGWGYNFRTLSNVATGENQLHSSQSSLSAWLVRDGDVGPQQVNNDPDPDPTTGQIPEPGSLALIALGLFGALYRRKMS